MFYATQDRREKIDGQFERNVRWILSHAFTNSEFFTLSEVAKYKPSEDITVWKQNRGVIPEHVEIYQKGEYLCEVDSGMTRDELVSHVWKNLELKKDREKEKEKDKQKEVSK